MTLRRLESGLPLVKLKTLADFTEMDELIFWIKRSTANVTFFTIWEENHMNLSIIFIIISYMICLFVKDSGIIKLW